MKKLEPWFALAGWTLFLLCSGFYIASAVRAGDGLALAGGVLFFLACFFFAVPLLISLRKK